MRDPVAAIRSTIPVDDLARIFDLQHAGANIAVCLEQMHFGESPEMVDDLRHELETLRDSVQRWLGALPTGDRAERSGEPAPPHGEYYRRPIVMPEPDQQEGFCPHGVQRGWTCTPCAEADQTRCSEEEST